MSGVTWSHRMTRAGASSRSSSAWWSEPGMIRWAPLRR